MRKKGNRSHTGSAARLNRTSPQPQLRQKEEETDHVLWGASSSSSSSSQATTTTTSTIIAATATPQKKNPNHFICPVLQVKTAHVVAEETAGKSAVSAVRLGGDDKALMINAGLDETALRVE
ncbi:hypothetical protein CRUP_015277 [Coryphaenoides rupestris]|nr:hypothetical protein CRUP_015277 [Coryphaenoides rupestris]